MKKMNLENKIEISRRKAGLAVVTAFCIMSMFVIVGCGKEKNAEPTTPSTTVTKEETTPMDEETTEPTQEETVEPTETVPETEDIESIVRNIDFSQYENALECINDLKKYDTLMIIVYGDEGGKQILVDGDSYTMDESDSFFLNRSPKDSDLKDAYFKVSDGEYKIDYTDDFYSIYFGISSGSGSCTIVLEYNDGTSEEMTITLE